VLFWLAVGIALNVLVAWFGSNFGPATQQWIQAREWSFWENRWPAPAPDGAMPPVRAQWDEYWWGRHYYALGTIEPTPREETDDEIALHWNGTVLGGQFESLRMDRYIVGWPCRSMTCWYTERWGLNPMSKVWHDAWTLEVNPRYAVLFPTKIIAGGFGLNTLFYTAAGWFLWRLPRWIRGLWRRGLGRCAACGYSLEGLTAAAACPECGVRINRAPR
jgi:hypothetical protein